MTFADQLRRLGACGDAIEWVGNRDAATAWRECQRGDHMIWLAAKAGDHRTVVLASCDCARLDLEYVPFREYRPRVALDTAEAWARGCGVTIEDVKAAARAADDAYASLFYAAPYAAPYAAAAARAATCAACTVYMVYDRALYASGAVTKMHRVAASTIVRRYFPVCPVVEGNG